MFAADLMLFFAFMGILFLRQIFILKQPNKINYAPLMVAIGFIASIVHFILHPEMQNFILLLRESLFPLLVSLLLFIVMNIMHQTQEKEQDKLHDEFSRIMVEQVKELKEFMSALEGRLTACQRDDREAQEEIREKFKEDINTLDGIQMNQTKFLKKFEEMDVWHQKVSSSFENFTKEQIPQLGSIIHEHIDILRVSEQDHYNKLKNTLEKAGASRGEIAEDMDAIKDSLNGIEGMAENVAQSISKYTLQQLSGVIKSFEQEIVSLKSYAEGVKTSLMESDTTLCTIKDKSEIIMKQMLLSAKRMESLQEQNSQLHNVYATIKELMDDMEAIKADYVKAQAELSVLSRELKETEHEQINAMKQEVDNVSKILTQKIEESLSQLHEHYHIMDEDISQSVQFLAKKAQVQRGYTELDK